MKRIHTTGKVILMGGLGVLLTLAAAAPAGAQTATDVVCTGCVASTDIADLGVASADLATGAVTGAKILDGTITAADLATGAVSSVKIADGAIVNADVSTAAAIAGTKVAPNFGSQNMVTTGNAGVGTTSPSSRLDVVGALTVRGMAAPTAASAGQGRLYYDSTANKFKVSQNGAAYVDLLGSGGSSQWTTSGSNIYYTTGSVGIGTTNPTSDLYIKGKGSVPLTIESPNGYASGLNLKIAIPGINDWSIVHGGYLGFVEGGTTGTPRITIREGGNVGIGTTGPGEELHISGGSDPAISLTSTNEANQVLINWFTRDAGIAGQFDGTTDRGWHVTGRGNQYGAVAEQNDLIFWRHWDGAWSNILTLDGPTGLVGIGTTEPEARLHVADPGTGQYTARFGAGAVSQFANVDVIANSGTNAFQVWDDNALTVPRFIVQRSGNVGIGTTAPDAKLDVRGAISSGGNDFFLGRYDGRNQGTTNANRALVHSDWGIGTDNLVINFDGDFEGGVHIMGPKTIIDGNVGIGTTDPGAYKLAVKGKIHAEEVVVDTGWADFVFKKDYDLMPLEKVAEHIQEAGHLPGIPTAQEVKENGVSIGQIQSKLLQKMEEMTLYVIELKKENETLKERISSLESRFQ